VRRTPDRIRFGDQTAGLERDGGPPVHDQPVAHHDVGARENRVDIAVRERDRADGVAAELAMAQGSLLGEGIAQRDDRRALIDLGDNQLRRVLGQILVIRHHDRDRLADITYDVAGERRLQQTQSGAR
jgi:hypothetical protein